LKKEIERKKKSTKIEDRKKENDEKKKIFLSFHVYCCYIKYLPAEGGYYLT